MNPYEQSKPRPGDYTTIRMMDSLLERKDCERTLRQNGCRSFRFEVLSDGRLLAHGYVAEGMA